MKIAIRRSSAVFVVCAVFAGHAFAAPGATCKQAPEIAAFADVLLARPHDLLPNGRISDAEIAYAKIKYGGLGSKDAEALVDTLSTRQFEGVRAKELKLVLGTPAERLAILRPDGDANSRQFFLQSVAFIHAVAMDGNLASLAKAALQDPDLGKNPDLLTAFIGPALSGSDDRTKTKLATQLEEMGLASTAATVLASEDDVQPWLRYVREHPRSYPTTRRLSYWFARDGGPQLRRLGFNGLAAPLSLGIADKDVLGVMASRETLSYPIGQWFDQIASQAYIGPEPLLALFQQIEQGDVAADDIDAVSVALLQNLDATIGRQKRDELLTAKRAIALRLVSYDADYFLLPAYFDTALARRALLPYLASHDSMPPLRPESMSAAFPWDQWVASANQIRDGLKPDGDVYIAAELLQASGHGFESAALLLPLARAGKDLPYLTAHTTKMLALLMRACGDESMGLNMIGALYRLDQR